MKSYATKLGKDEVETRDRKQRRLPGHEESEGQKRMRYGGGVDDAKNRERKSKVDGGRKV